jgi:hypothetical protein
MLQNNTMELEKQAGGSPDQWEQPWPCAETLKTLTELNEQCLELLAEQALLRAPHAPPMFRELVDLWSQLNAASRHRAAGCPYLLIDAGFADPYRWKWVGANRVGDREPASYTAFFTALGATKVAHQVFTNAWYIARTQPIGAPLFLGMPSHCANLLAACTMRQVTDLANQHTGWLRPRWAGRVRIWRELLVAAISGEGLALEMARLHGIQLLAMELKALEQVNAKEPRSL